MFRLRWVLSFMNMLDSMGRRRLIPLVTAVGFYLTSSVADRLAPRVSMLCWQ